MTQSDNKIKGKFYPLQHEEWLHSINQLTHAELKVLYYLRSLDPYNNGIDLTPAQIAKDLSTPEHPVHRSTVGRALKSLDAKSFINLELIQVRVKVNPKGFHVATSQQSCDDTTQVVATQHKLSPRNIHLLKLCQSKSLRFLRSIRLIKILKTLSLKTRERNF